MGKKIKEVSIEAFRAYEKLQPFDFKHKDSGEIANLVVIYAPNGYGKTSFFDAIEWAFTDEIGRFRGTEAIKQEVKNEKGDILKNKNSHLAQGTVRIISETDDVFEIKTKKRTGKMKSDYKPGELEVISKDLQGILYEKNSFCTTNMLAHDKITSFLQNYTAEDKTKALQVFWDTNGYSNVLEKTKNLYDEIVKKRMALSSEVLKEKQELNQYKFETDKEYNVRFIINDFNLKCVEYKINAENIIDNIDNVLEEIVEILKKIQENRYQYELNLNTIELLTNEFPNYLSKKDELEIIKNEKKEYETKLEILNQIDMLLLQKEKLKIEQKGICIVINDWNLFQNIELELAEKNDLRKKFTDFKMELQKSIIHTRENINTSRTNVEQYIQLKKKILEEKKLIETELSKYNDNKVNLNKYSKLNNKASFILTKRVEKRKILSDTISSIEIFMEEKSNIDLIKHYLTDDILCINKKLVTLKSEKAIQEKNIIQIEERYKSVMLLNDKINQLVLQGKELVEDTKNCECPLCHAKYDNFSILITRISTDYKSNLELEGIKKELDKGRILNAHIIENIAMESQNLKNSVLNILEKVKKEYNKHSERIHNLQLQVSDWNNLITNIQKDNEIIERKYYEQSISIQDIETINLQKLKIDKTVFDLSVNIDNEELKNITNLDMLKDKENELKNIELKSVEIEEKISELKDNNTYQSILMFLSNNNYREVNDDLQCVLKKVMEEKNNVDKKMADTEMKIIDSQNKINGTKEEVNFQYNTLLIQLQELTAIIDGYMLRCKNAFGNLNVEGKYIGEHLEKLREDFLYKKNCADERISDLNSIFTDTKSLKEMKIWLNKTKEYERKNSKLGLIKAKLENLEKSKTVVENYIVDQTNEYFNSNTINQIYNKIDPHPTMNHIKFLTENSGKGLQTHIYTYDKSEEDKMSPVLYLSSAQVNILSLCIFLAKVLTEKDTTLNTIFMDDPIQHLDGINLLAFIDLLRTITTVMGRQIVISTHNEHFYNLIKVKMDDRYYLSKFIELNSVGEIRGKQLNS